MKPEPNLQFSLGPVQGFIGQARRTRDLWSGSYILSYLSARAMKGIIDCDGKIILPQVWEDDGKNDLLLSWVMEDKSGDPPRIGTIPNRFQAWADDPKNAAEAAKEQIKAGWRDIESAVWNLFVKDVASKHGFNTQEIWDRQVNDFWEIYWTVGKVPTMETRKNWRTKHSWIRELPELEGGDHCTIMGEWQEISGFIRSQSRVTRTKQDNFWKKMREIRPGVGRLDFRDDERLCAIALIKRMFPKVAKDAISWDVEADRWPSTVYVAALPWLREIAEKESNITRLANYYSTLVLKAADEKAVRRPGVWEQVGGLNVPDLMNFLELDGNFYFKSAVENQRHTPLKGTPLEWNAEESEKVKEKRQDLIKHLGQLNKEACLEPSLFYGMLLMDGDNMGKMLTDYGEEVSKALSKFSDQVDSNVRGHGGVTVYAGGDDVLAMLPVNSSIGCAMELAVCFENAFADFDVSGTVSAGLVLANGKVPLRSVLQDAHYILDDVAKDGNGRQSLAVSVLKGSGKYCQWVTTWPSLKYDGSNTVLDSLTKAISGEEKQFSTSFFFRVREILTMLSSEPFWRPGSCLKLTEVFQEDDILDLLTAEYMKSKHGDDIEDKNKDIARSLVEQLLSICYRCYRDDDETCITDKRRLSADGAMLVKFLSEEGGNENW